MTTRRHVLQVIGGASLRSAAPALAAGGEGAASAPLRAGLLALLGDPESACAIGRDYLRTRPARERSAAVLIELIAGDGPCPDGSCRDRAVWRAWLAARQRSDFAEGRTATVEGWILSQTEARLCALAAVG